MVKNPPASAEGTDSIPGWGKSPHVVGQRGLDSRTTEALMPRGHAPQEKPSQWEAWALH